MALNMDRRSVLAAVPGALLALGARGKEPVPQARTPKGIPKGFLWGVATAGHQVEGNNVNSDVWLLEHVTPTIYKEPSGDACDSLNRWSEDLDIVRDIGVNTYRFSLEWARIEPVEGQFSIAMLDHYKRIVAGCHERGLTPFVTFNHFTAPRWFAAQGGWQRPEAADQFARFCERATKHLGDQLSFATTLNEPNLMRLLRWLALSFRQISGTCRARCLQPRLTLVDRPGSQLPTPRAMPRRHWHQ